MISGVWGYVTNKHLAGIPGTGFLLNTQSYVRLHCLPVVLRVFGRGSVYSCRIDKPLITAYNRVIILNCYSREMRKNLIFWPWLHIADICLFCRSLSSPRTTTLPRNMNTGMRAWTTISPPRSISRSWSGGFCSLWNEIVTHIKICLCSGQDRRFFMRNWSGQ